MRFIICVLLFLLPIHSFGQVLLPSAKELRNAYKELLASNYSDLASLKYLNTFPSTTRSFLEIFTDKNFGQLYNDSYLYIEAFGKSAASNPQLALTKDLTIAKELVWDADAINYFQKTTVRLAIEFPKVFIVEYEKLSPEERDMLIVFLADVENHLAYEDYQLLIDTMKQLHKAEVVEKFERARRKRMKQHHD